MTKIQAQAILDIRKQQAEDGVVLPIPAFIQHLVALGCLPKPCSGMTLWRLLSGRLYPDLQDSRGRPYDYSAMPRAARGPRRMAREQRESLEQRIEKLEGRLNHIE